MRLPRNLIDTIIASLSRALVRLCALVGHGITVRRQQSRVVREEQNVYQVRPPIPFTVVREAATWQRQRQRSGTAASLLTEQLGREVKFDRRAQQQLEKEVEERLKRKPRQASAVYHRPSKNSKAVEPKPQTPEKAVEAGESKAQQQVEELAPPVQQQRNASPEPAPQPANPSPSTQFLHRERSASLPLPPPPPSPSPKKLPPPLPTLILPGLSSRTPAERRARKASLQKALGTAIKRATMRASQDSSLSGTTVREEDVLVSGSTELGSESEVEFDWKPVRRRASSVVERKGFEFNVNAAEFRPGGACEGGQEMPKWTGRRVKASPLFPGPDVRPTTHQPDPYYQQDQQNPRIPTYQQPPQQDTRTPTYHPNLSPQQTQTADSLREHHRALLASLHHYAPAYLALGRLYHSTPLTARSSPWILPAFQHAALEAFTASETTQLPELVQVLGEVSMRLSDASAAMAKGGGEALGKTEAELKRCDELLGEAAVRLKMLQSAVAEICGVFEREREVWWVEDEEGMRERMAGEGAWMAVVPEVCKV